MLVHFQALSPGSKKPLLWIGCWDVSRLQCLVSSSALSSLQGSFLVTQAVAQALVACGARKGSIITIGSIVGKV